LQTQLSGATSFFRSLWVRVRVQIKKTGATSVLLLLLLSEIGFADAMSEVKTGAPSVLQVLLLQLSGVGRFCCSCCCS
jgi:hypothetical protein